MQLCYVCLLRSFTLFGSNMDTNKMWLYLQTFFSSFSYEWLTTECMFCLFVKDFYVGAILEMNKQQFLITSADDYVFEFMERPEMVSMFHKVLLLRPLHLFITDWHTHLLRYFIHLLFSFLSISQNCLDFIFPLLIFSSSFHFSLRIEATLFFT